MEPPQQGRNSPTLAAARYTWSGFSDCMKSMTACWFSRSSSRRVRLISIQQQVFLTCFFKECLDQGCFAGLSRIQQDNRFILKQPVLYPAVYRSYYNISGIHSIISIQILDLMQQMIGYWVMGLPGQGPVWDLGSALLSLFGAVKQIWLPGWSTRVNRYYKTSLNSSTVMPASLMIPAIVYESTGFERGIVMILTPFVMVICFLFLAT